MYEIQNPLLNELNFYCLRRYWRERKLRKLIELGRLLNNQTNHMSMRTPSFITTCDMTAR